MPVVHKHVQPIAADSAAGIAGHGNAITGDIQFSIIRDNPRVNGHDTFVRHQSYRSSSGTAALTQGIGGKKQTCKVSVKNAKKGTVIYNFAKSTNPDNHPPYKADYSEFKYNSFRIWLCDATFWGEKTYISPDYRGRKLSISLKVKNSGKRTLPEMGVCFNYTKGGDTGAYPWALHVSAKKLSAKVKKDKTHKHCKIVTKAMKKGKSYTFNFTFTIPKNAVNGDTDKDTGANYPIMMYIPNMKDTSPYKEGDSITVQKCVIKVA